jgi:LysM repeat protein
MRGRVLSVLKPPPAPRRATATAARRGATRASAAREDIHIVRPRDTVSSIAKRYGVAVADVLRWNRLAQEARIWPGDRLRIADVVRSASEGQGGFR